MHVSTLRVYVLLWTTVLSKTDAHTSVDENKLILWGSTGLAMKDSLLSIIVSLPVRAKVYQLPWNAFVWSHRLIEFDPSDWKRFSVNKYEWKRINLAASHSPIFLALAYSGQRWAGARGSKCELGYHYHWTRMAYYGIRWSWCRVWWKKYMLYGTMHDE